MYPREAKKKKKHSLKLTAGKLFLAAQGGKNESLLYHNCDRNLVD